MTAVQGIAIYALNSLMELAERLGTQSEIPDAGEWKKKLTPVGAEAIARPEDGAFCQRGEEGAFVGFEHLDDFGGSGFAAGRCRVAGSIERAQ